MKKGDVKEERKKVLFLCTHNSARSQMAEGLLKAFYGTCYEPYSAGITPTQVNPYAIKVMAEMGIDISTHRSKGVDEFKEEKFDYVITVCDYAKEMCPLFPHGGKQLHKGFTDPAAAKGTEGEILNVFREARNKIKNWILETFDGKE